MLDWKKILSILGICSGCVVIALVFSMVNTALPEIQKNLGLSVNATQWMMNVFGIINCAILVTCGRLADIYGRKRLFMIGLASSLIAMIFGGFCKDCFGLILCMCFAGIGNAIILPVSQALLISEFPEDQKGRAIGIWASAIAGALAGGPVLGGLVTGFIGWQWVYWINAPVVAGSLLLVFFFSRESRNSLDTYVDYKGMFLLGMTVASFALLVTEFATLPNYAILLLCVSMGLGSFLLWKIERHCPSPILRGDLLGNKRFLAASIANACLVFYIWSIFFLLPLYLQNVRLLTPLKSGLLMLGITLPVACLSPMIGKLYRHQTAWMWLTLGFGLLIISTFIQSRYTEHTDLFWVGVAATIFGLADGCIWGPSTTSAISNLSVEQAGISSGTFATIQEIGGIMGLATTVTIARSYDNFMVGFQQSMLVLLAVGFVGSLCAAYLFYETVKVPKKITES